MTTQDIFVKIAEASPGFADFMEATRDELRESPYRAEVVEEMSRLVKVASGFMDSFPGKALVGGGLAIAGGIAHSLAGDMYDAMKRGLTKGRNYRSMISENPDLHDRPAKDVQRAFGTLHQFNPEFASDPHVAGSYVRQQLTLAGEHGQVDLQSLTNLVGARKSIQDSKKLLGKMPEMKFESPNSR